MPEHGDYDSGSRKWYCSYWQSLKEWEDIHDYDPSSPSTENIDNAFNKDTGDKPENYSKDF